MKANKRLFVFNNNPENILKSRPRSEAMRVMDENRYNCIVVCGPTACGKTSLGVRLAQRFHGEIISADSRQVYRGMDIGTGKDLDEYSSGSAVPYHLIDIADPSEVYTLYRYCADFNRVWNDCAARHVLPVIVGGTGLYIEACIKQYDIPRAPEDVSLRESLMQQDKDTLAKKLQALSPEIYARTDLSSCKRIVRAIEVAMSDGSNDGFEKEPLSVPIVPYVIGIAPLREELIRRIDARLDARLSRGMIDEVAALMQKGISRDRLLMFGMEYKYIALHLYDELSYDQMREELANAIHRLSKRQMTWFRGLDRRGIPVIWHESFDDPAILRDCEDLFRHDF